MSMVWNLSMHTKKSLSSVRTSSMTIIHLKLMSPRSAYVTLAPQSQSDACWRFSTIIPIRGGVSTRTWDLIVLVWSTSGWRFFLISIESRLINGFSTPENSQIPVGTRMNEKYWLENNLITHRRKKGLLVKHDSL